MDATRMIRAGLVIGLVATLSACGGGVSGWHPFKRNAAATVPAERTAPARKKESTIWDLFKNAADPNVTVDVNKYLWNASLDVLNFLPIQSVDPFTGVIVTGYGTPPGGRRSYRATIYVSDPALDARSLKVAIETHGGPASPATVRAVEDAILTRARQMRIADSKL